MPCRFFWRPTIVSPAGITDIIAMRILLAIAALAASAFGAGAAPCASRPDTAATHYNQNQLATALCQQQALDAEVGLRQLQGDLDAELRNLQRQIDLQRQLLEAQQAAAATLP